jgi:hypothetical protein
MLASSGQPQQLGQSVGWHLRLSRQPAAVSDRAALVPGAELEKLRPDDLDPGSGGAGTTRTDRSLPQHDFGAVVVAGHQDLFNDPLQRP